ncbi:MAG: YvcK family protein, partial [Clostridia bacterium]
MQSKVKWLYPGMGVKRWLLLVGLGVVLFGVGSSLAFGLEIFSALQQVLIRPLASALGTLPQIASTLLGVVGAGVGLVLIVAGIRQTIRSVAAIFLKENVDRLPDIVFEQRQLKRGPRVVAIGGGTGLSTLLRGIKEYTSNITAIVTVADDGGSSGRLRSELGIPPPGDIRNTLVALADTEPLMERLFQYRFSFGEGLKGHSFGNLFIAAMSEVTGDFEAAVKESSKVLAVRGKVLPSTLDQVVLKAEYDDGSRVTGESRIPCRGKRIRRVYLAPAAAR